MTCIQINDCIVCVQPTFKAGDPAPEGYLAWHDWAEVQHKAGLRQKRCGCYMEDYDLEMLEYAQSLKRAG